MSNPRLMSGDRLKKELSDLELNIKIFIEELDYIEATNMDNSGFGVYWTLKKKLYMYKRKAEWVDRCIHGRDFPIKDVFVYNLEGVKVINFQ